MHKLCFYVPEPQLESVKQAVFAAGAGRSRGYDNSCWQTLGHGQFRPLPGSDPHAGESGKLEVVAEYKVEMIVDDDRVADVVAALLAAHPYEEPAYDLWPLLR